MDASILMTLLFSVAQRTQKYQAHLLEEKGAKAQEVGVYRFGRWRVSCRRLEGRLRGKAQVKLICHAAVADLEPVVQTLGVWWVVLGVLGSWGSFVFCYFSCFSFLFFWGGGEVRCWGWGVGYFRFEVFGSKKGAL